MSIARSETNPEQKTAGKPHTLHLAVHFKDSDSGRLVDYAVRLDREPTLAADVDAVVEQFRQAVSAVFEHAATDADATITVALLRQGR